VIRAPVTGTILDRTAEKGELITAQFASAAAGGPQGSVVSLADLNDLQVELDIAQSDFARLGRRDGNGANSWSQTYHGFRCAKASLALCILLCIRMQVPCNFEAAAHMERFLLIHIGWHARVHANALCLAGRLGLMGRLGW